MRRRRPTAALVLALAALAALAALGPPAAAAGGPGPRPAAGALLSQAAAHGPTPDAPSFFQPVIPLGRHGNYTMEAFGRQGRVHMLVSLGGRAAALYVAPGTTTPTRLEASFGELGRISMRFRVSSNRTWVKPHRNCRGKQRYVNRRGVFVGGLRFRGERGYVSVRIRRAKGHVTAVAPECRRKSSGGGIFPFAATSAAKRTGPVPATLRLSWLDGVEATAFSAQARPRGTRFAAEAAETDGKLAVFRFAQATGGPGRLRIDEQLTTARTNPPAPFSGSGAYRAAPDGTFTWDGSLRVNFPGAPRTPLIETPFRAHLGGGI